MKRIIIASVLVVLLAGGFVIIRWDYSGRNVSETEHAITLYGNVDIRQVELAFRVAGRISEIYVEEGDRVEPGDLVAELDAEPFEEEVALRKAELARAEAELEKFRNGFRAQEIKSARARLEERKAVLKNIEKEFERRQKLLENGAVSRQSFDNIRSSLDEARARFKTAQEELSLFLEGYRKEEIKAAEASRNARLARLELARTSLADTDLFSPSHGTVMTRVREPGSMVGKGATVLTVSRSEPVWVRAYISEPRLGLIRPGMPAQVYTDTRPDKPVKGHIGFISPEAEFTPKSVETPELRTQLVYRFRVVVKDPGDKLRRGMPVTVKINPGKGQVSYSDEGKRRHELKTEGAEFLE